MSASSKSSHTPSSSPGERLHSFPPSDFIMPEDFARGLTSSGFSVIDSNSVVDPDNKRTYQAYKEGKYLLPNDGQEQERLDLQHHMYLLLFDGKLSLAPMTTEPAYVLDVATGTGIWAREFGTDLSKIQPQQDLSNVEFLVDDSEEEWVFPQVPHFDYIHFRLVFTCFNDPELVMKHAFNVLAPGGWIEYQDIDPEVFSVDGSAYNTTVERFTVLCNDGLAKRGRDPMVARRYKDWMVKLGFVDVTEKRYPCPSNPWPNDSKFKEVGEFCLKNYYDGVRGISWKLLEATGLSPEGIETAISDYRNDAKNTNIKAHNYFYVVYGRKPLPGETGSTQAKTEIIGLPTANGVYYPQQRD